MLRAQYSDLPIKPPFAVFTYGNMPGNYNNIVDQEGRLMTLDWHEANFAKELCAIMNENADRLVHAWKIDVEIQKRNKKCRKGKRTSP